MMTRMIPILALVSALGLAACQEEEAEMETEVETEEVETEEVEEAEETEAQ